jgi:hypothetical protein
MKSKELIVVDMDGLRSIAEGAVHKRGFGIIGGEIWQNCMDERPTRVNITIEPVEGQPLIHFKAEDDGPGYRDLSHAWTMYAPSYKKSDPEKAGRFNVGCKFVLCFCKTAKIHTTSGLVTFDREEGREVFPRRKRESGTLFEATMYCTRERHDQLIQYMHQVLPPLAVRLYLNGKKIVSRAPVGQFEETLSTVIGDDLRPSRRKTVVQVHSVKEGEQAHLYELGVPVVPIECKWHLNVMQKVPLNTDRDNVSPKYVSDLLAFTLNEMHQHLTEEDVRQPWATEATDNPNCKDAAMKTYLDKKFTEKRFVPDPTDPESSKRLVANGYTPITSNALTDGQREKVRNNRELAPLSSFLMPTPSPYSDNPNAPPVKVISEDKWSDGMRNIHNYTVALSRKLLGREIEVRFVHTTNKFSACYGRGCSFDFNVLRLSKKWFDGRVQQKHDRLILHEFGHHYSDDHLSNDYYDALCELGAKLKELALRDPAFFSEFVPKHTS